MKVKYLIAMLILLAVFLVACSPAMLKIDRFEANFRGHMVELYGETVRLTDIYPGENYLKLHEDGSGVIAFSDVEDNVTWRIENDTYFITVEGAECVAEISDGIMTMELEGGLITYVAEGAKAPEIPTTQTPNYDEDLSVAYGTYHGLTINEFGNMSDMSDFYGGECYIRLDDDGMGVLFLGGSELEIAWELNGTDFTVADMNGINSIGYLEDGILVLDYMETGLQLAFAKEGAAN